MIVPFQRSKVEFRPPTRVKLLSGFHKTSYLFIPYWSPEFITKKSIFFEEYSGKETLAELKKKFFDWLVAHVFKKGRSVEWYEVFFQTYGHGFQIL